MPKSISKFLFSALILALVLSSCSTYSEEQKEEFNSKVDEYVNEKGWKTKTTDTGLQYVVEEEGEGKNIRITDKVLVHYKGYLTDGTVFDSTSSEPREFKLKETLLGWREGFSFFKEGGKGKLIIPPHLGYGDNKQQGIPENSILVFEFEILEVK